MMYSVGLPANLSKKKERNATVLEVFLFHLAPWGFTIVMFFLFWTKHVTNPVSVFIGLVPLYGGQSMAIFSNAYYIRFRVNLGHPRFSHSSSDRTPQLNVDILETQYLISMNIPSSN